MSKKFGRPNKLQQIKAKQLEQDPDCYARKPVIRIDHTADLKPASQGLPTLDMMQAVMQTDLQRLAQMDTLEAKARYKADALKNYTAFISDYMEKGHDTPNDVAVRIMIWLFDIGDIEHALRLGLYLVQTGKQVMPPKFDRDIQTFIADAVYDWASEQLKAGHSASPYLYTLVEAVEAGQWDLHPAVKSKNLAMAAKHAARVEDWKATVKFCELAEAANPDGAGVKTLKADAEKNLKKLEEAKAEAGENG